METRLLLPAVDFVRPVIVVESSFPPQAVAGAPFPYTLRLRNESSLLQHVQVSVGANDSFMFSGPDTLHCRVWSALDITRLFTSSRDDLSPILARSVP